MDEQSRTSEPGNRGDRLGRSLAIGAVLGLVVLCAFALWSDARGIGQALARFPISVAVLACGLSLANYGLRFLRWQRYLTVLGIKIPIGTSFLISLAGLAFTVSPGKLGEAYKSWLVKEVTGTPIHVTAPIVLAERFTDLLAFLVLIAIGGLATSPDHAWIFGAVLAGCAALLAFAVSPRLQEFALARIARMPVVARFVPRVRDSLTSVRALFAPRELVFPTVIATLGWGLECVGFYCVVNAFVPDAVTLSFATYTFALSAVAGAVLILFPGGLGPTEASMSALLTPRYVAAGLGVEAARASAASATLVIRLCTLWFAVLVGAIAALVFRRRFSARNGSASSRDRDDFDTRAGG